MIESSDSSAVKIDRSTPRGAVDPPLCASLCSCVDRCVASSVLAVLLCSALQIRSLLRLLHRHVVR